MKLLYRSGNGFAPSVWDMLYWSSGVEQSLLAGPNRTTYVQVVWLTKDGLLDKDLHETSIPVTDPVLLAFYED